MSEVKLVLDRVTALTQFVGKGILFNLNYLPDTILGGIVLFALLMQSAPLAILGTSLFSLEFIHAGLASFLQNAIPGLNEATKNVSQCSGHFPGISYERVLSGLVNQGTLKTMSVSFPSYYMMFFGTLFGYILGTEQTYSRELQALPKRQAAIYAGTIVMGLLSLLFAVFRINSGCDSFLSVLVGSLVGLLFGYVCEKLVATLSNNTLTNLLNLPLIRDKATDGKPIYVCKKN